MNPQQLGRTCCKPPAWADVQFACLHDWPSELFQPDLSTQAARTTLRISITLPCDACMEKDLSAQVRLTYLDLDIDEVFLSTEEKEEE